MGSDADLGLSDVDESFFFPFLIVYLFRLLFHVVFIAIVSDVFHHHGTGRLDIERSAGASDITK